MFSEWFLPFILCRLLIHSLLVSSYIVQSRQYTSSLKFSWFLLFFLRTFYSSASLFFSHPFFFVPCYVSNPFLPSSVLPFFMLSTFVCWLLHYLRTLLDNFCVLSWVVLKCVSSFLSELDSCYFSLVLIFFVLSFLIPASNLADLIHWSLATFSQTGLLVNNCFLHNFFLLP